MLKLNEKTLDRASTALCESSCSPPFPLSHRLFSSLFQCSDVPLASDVFLTALRLSDDVGELHATRDAVNKEIALLVSTYRPAGPTRNQSGGGGGNGSCLAGNRC